jgi:hypothetical protein
MSKGKDDTSLRCAKEIIEILKKYNCTIRGYEGETSCVIIESDKLDDYGAEIDNDTQEVSG